MTTEKNATQNEHCNIDKINDAGTLEKRLQELLNLMKLQVQNLASENYDRFIALSKDVSKYLEIVSNAQVHITHVSFDYIKEIQNLNQKIGLTLSSRSDDLAERMKKVKTGKQVVRAYNNAL